MAHKPEIDVFLATMPETDDCIEWPFARFKFGYAKLAREGRTQKVSHIVLEAAGEPRPDGAYALHSCDNPPCVNRRHLRWGTHAENMADTAGKRDMAGEKNPNRKLTEEDVMKIRNDPRTLQEIADEFGVSNQLVSRIKLRQAWNH